MSDRAEHQGQGQGQGQRTPASRDRLAFDRSDRWGLVFLLGAVAVLVLLGSLDLGGLDVSFGLDLPWVPVLAGMVIAMLAEAFKAGSRLRDDVDGLV